MGKTEEIYPSGKYKWKGTVDLKLFYKSLWGWLEDGGYGVVEKKYGERVKPFGKQIEFVWVATKKEGKYFKKQIDLDFFAIGVQDADVERDGKQLKLQKCELEVGFKAEITLNASDEWHDGFVHTVYKDHILKDKIDEEKIGLYDNVHDLVSEMKTFLELYHFS